MLLLAMFPWALALGYVLARVKAKCAETHEAMKTLSAQHDAERLQARKNGIIWIPR
jgi:hypothetical protein